jgi:hypothetical protein
MANLWRGRQMIGGFMDRIKQAAFWLINFVLAFVFMPWMIVMTIKLVISPSLLTNREAEIVLTIKSEANKEIDVIDEARDFVVVFFMSYFSSPSLGLWLWISLAISYMFRWAVNLLAFDENSGGENP